MTFVWSDAWILTAVAVASCDAPAELWQVLAAADAIDHALPLDEELHGAFVRLSAAGYLEETDGKFALGRAVPENVKILLIQSLKNYKEAETLLSSEKKTAAGNVGDARNSVRYPTLSSDRIRQADKQYRRWYAKSKQSGN